MLGELNFAESLLQRVALLKGLDEPALLSVYEERVKLSEVRQSSIHPPNV